MVHRPRTDLNSTIIQLQHYTQPWSILYDLAIHNYFPFLECVKHSFAFSALRLLFPCTLPLHLLHLPSRLYNISWESFLSCAACFTMNMISQLHVFIMLEDLSHCLLFAHWTLKIPHRKLWTGTEPVMFIIVCQSHFSAGRGWDRDHLGCSSWGRSP